MTRINDTEITQKLFSEIALRRNDGAKIFLVIPEETELDRIHYTADNFVPCNNCHGSGQIGIQIIVGGPYDEPHQKYEEARAANGEMQKHNLGCIYHRGKYFNVKTILDNCPCCDNGRVARKPAPRQQVAVPA